MENPEEVLQLLERFSKLKQKEIPRELDEYLSFVAKTGDTVYRWAVVKTLFREKLLSVITDFHDNTASITDLPQYPNVDPFHYDRMKRTLLERLDAFSAAPFTVQRICELLTEPRKQYTRIDKFMRAFEKNILVVSTQEPGRQRSDSENDSIVNGDLEVNVDIEMDHDQFGHLEASGSEKECTLKDELPVEAKLIELEVEQQEPSLTLHENTETDAVVEEPTTEEKKIDDDIEKVNEAENCNENSIIETDKPSNVELMLLAAKEAVEEQVNVDSEPLEENDSLVNAEKIDQAVEQPSENVSDDLQEQKSEPENTDIVDIGKESTPIETGEEKESPTIAQENDEQIESVPEVESITPEIVEVTEEKVSSESAEAEETVPVVVTEEEDKKDDVPAEVEPVVEQESPKIEEVPVEQEASHEVIQTHNEPIIEEAIQEEAKLEEPVVVAPEISEAAIVDEIVTEEGPKAAPVVEMMDSNSLAPENVMSTDDEDVVPMAEEQAKPDDQDMEVDESSVEPMDQ